MLPLRETRLWRTVSCGLAHGFLQRMSWAGSLLSSDSVKSSGEQICVCCLGVGACSCKSLFVSLCTPKNTNLSLTPAFRPQEIRCLGSATTLFGRPTLVLDVNCSGLLWSSILTLLFLQPLHDILSNFRESLLDSDVVLGTSFEERDPELVR